MAVGGDFDVLARKPDIDAAASTPSSGERTYQDKRNYYSSETTSDKSPQI